MRAGHLKDDNTIDFSRCTVRPGSAPLMTSSRVQEMVQPWLSSTELPEDGFVYTDDVSICVDEVGLFAILFSTTTHTLDIH